MPESTRSSRGKATDTDPHLWVTILAGGVGSRFWPVSTPSRPKQLLPLGGERPLIEETVERARALAPLGRIRVLAPPALAGALAGAAPELPPDSFWSEPTPRGTAPVLLWAAWRIHRQDPDAVIVSLHSDHLIRPLPAFRALLLEAARVAERERLLLTVGAVADRPEVGFGYLQPGEPLPAPPGVSAFRVARFREKPDAEEARRYLEAGYLWNTGLFVWRASTFLEEAARHAPELADRLPLLETGAEREFFERCPESSVDVAVLERSSRVGAVRATFEWDDVGSWEALARTLARDAQGNALQGEVHAVDSAGNIVFTEDGPVVLFGTEDLVVVRTAQVTLVTTRARAPEMKELLARLPESLRRLR